MNNEKKSNNGWLIAVVIAIVVLLIGVIAGSAVIVYKLAQLSSEEQSVASIKESDSRDNDSEDDFDFEFDHSYQYRDEESEEETETESDNSKYDESEGVDSFPHVNSDISGNYNIEDYSYTDSENGEIYYKELKDATRSDLNYSVSWKAYEYETDYEYVSISASYPELVGENIPNLEYINDYIFDEVEYWVESFEEYVDAGYFYEDDEFMFLASAYVTYMDEEKISIVFSEYGEADGSTMYYLYSINIDVQNGVILDNNSIVDIDDDFAVEFRERNREQNDADGYIDEMTDQEIVEYLNSPTMGVVFYTPLGLEVGINLDYGWYTVTFRDYEKYLEQL